MAEENRSTHKLYEKDKIGEVQIADEVVAVSYTHLDVYKRQVLYAGAAQ